MLTAWYQRGEGERVCAEDGAAGGGGVVVVGGRRERTRVRAEARTLPRRNMFRAAWAATSLSTVAADADDARETALTPPLSLSSFLPAPCFGRSTRTGRRK